MKNQKIYNKYFLIVRKEISKTLRISESKVKLKSKFSNFKNWDSLAYINIVINLQKKTGKKFKLDSIADLEIVENWVNYLYENEKK
jgi:acyl carrier protein